MIKKKRKCKMCRTILTESDGRYCQSCRLLLPKMPATPEHAAMETGAYFKAPELTDKPKYSSIWHNLTSEQVKALRKLQGDKCHCCGRKLFLVLNCDKATNKARGYLCRGCAVKLSGVENPAFVKWAKEFIDNPPANNLE